MNDCNIPTPAELRTVAKAMAQDPSIPRAALSAQQAPDPDDTAAVIDAFYRSGAAPEVAPVQPSRTPSAQWGRLYTTANALIASVGYKGEIDALADEVASLQDALGDLDGGAWMPGLQPAAPVQEPTADECECGYGCPPGNGCRHSGEPAAAVEPPSPLDDKSHPRFMAGYSAGLHDRKLNDEAAAVEPAKIQKCALCWNNARVGNTCDACHDSMGTKAPEAAQATPAPVLPFGLTEAKIDKIGISYFQRGYQKEWRQFAYDILAASQPSGAPEPVLPSRLLTLLLRARDERKEGDWQMMHISLGEAFEIAGKLAAQPSGEEKQA